MTSLHEILWDLRNEDLAYRLKLLGIKPRSPRKADLIEGLKSSLQGDNLKRVWDTLDDLQKNTVAEACYSPSRAYDPTRIKAKYGNLPAFYTPEGERNSYLRKNLEHVTPLNLFLFELRDSPQERIVPSDLAEVLLEWIPEPPELRLPTSDEPEKEEGLFVRQTQHEALAEVVALIHLADQGKLSLSPKTGNISPAVCRKMTDCLIGGDFFPAEVTCRPEKRSYEQEIGPIKAIAWARLLQMAKYIAPNGNKTKLTRSGLKALSQPPEQVIRHIWTQWLANTQYDEFNRIDVVKGQRAKGHMTGKPGRRSAIVNALEECPAGKWIAPKHFSDFMQASGFGFEVSRNLWKLYLCDSHYGSLGYQGYGTWNIVQHRYILCFLFEYAATLGLIDIAYVHPRMALSDYCAQWGGEDLEWLSRYDGLRCFRITELGAYCLGLTGDFEQSLPRSGLKLAVLPSLRIQVRSGEISPSEKLQLETWAEPIKGDSWKLDHERSLEAIERGHKPTDFAEFLNKHDDQDLPDTVKGFLRNCERTGKALQICGEAFLVRCRDAETADLICAQKELEGHCYRSGETALTVTAEQLAKFRKVVRSLGIGFTPHTQGFPRHI